MFPTLTLLVLAAKQTAPETPRSVLTALVQAINAEDPEKLRAFVASHAKPNAAVSQMVQRWRATLQQGVPFKIVGEGKHVTSEVDAFVTDKEGTRLFFQLHLTADLKLNGLRISPAYLAEGPDPSFAGWSSLQGLAQTIVEKDHVPAMGLAVMRDGKLEVASSGVRELGKKDLVGVNDVWSIGSIGKSICSTVIGKLIELGKLRWSETLAEALPGVEMEPGYKEATLEQVMHHRGGIPMDSGFSGEDIDKIVARATKPTDIRFRYIRYVLRRPPIAKPGTEFNYSNAGYSLLSVIAERAAGEPYEKLVHEYVFQPLGLKHSYTDIDPLPNARPSGHLPGDKGLLPGNMTGAIEPMLAGAGGGLFMSVGDLATYGAAHMAGLQGKDGFLKAVTIQRLHKGIPEIPGGRKYACGWEHNEVPSLQGWDGHNGSNGTMRSELAIFPDANLVVVGIANSGGESEPSPGFTAVMAIAQKYAPAK